MHGAKNADVDAGEGGDVEACGAVVEEQIGELWRHYSNCHQTRTLSATKTG